jgi:16S rRNA pseudouridine516 synthase
VKKLIRSKQVSIDGEIVLAENHNVDPQIQAVVVSGKTLTHRTNVYYMLHKPAGVVTAVSDEGNRTVIDLIDPSDRRPGLYPVGRLDKDTEGLLLITDNGQLGYQLLLPHKKVTKRYEVVVNERVTAADQEAFAEGIVFHGGTTCKPACLTILSHGDDQSRVLLDISEGKFHQVKKMFLSVGKKVTYLKRLTMGPIELDESIPPGSYRPLNEAELEQLKPYFR